MNPEAISAALAAAEAGVAQATAGILTAALATARAFHVLALRPLSKHPLDGLTATDATQDADTIRGWWGREPWANIGISPRDGGFIIDVDGDEGRESLAALPNPLPRTLTSNTYRGQHLHFRTDAFARGWLVTDIGHKFAPGIDLIASSGWVPVAQATLIRDGAAFGYRWDARVACGWGMDAAIAEAPSWLVDHIETRGLGLRMA